MQSLSKTLRDHNVWDDAHQRYELAYNVLMIDKGGPVEVLGAIMQARARSGVIGASSV